MGFLDDIKGRVVALDTAPIIYFIERNPTYHLRLRPFFIALANGEFTAVTSAITLTETLIHPLRNKHHQLAQRYQTILLNSANLTTFDLTPEIAHKAAEIRAKHNIRTPDAIQIATAIHGKASYFLTNDQALQKFPDIAVQLVDTLS